MTIPTEILDDNANCWVVLTTVRLVHPSYGDAVRGKVVGGDARQPHPTRESAEAEAQALIDDAARPLRDGWVRQTELVSVSIRGYYQPEGWAQPPMSGAEWAEAWANGPGAEA